MHSSPRRSPRLECDLLVQWRRGRRSYSGRVRRYNQHGIFIQTEPAAMVNYLIDVTIAMPWGPVDFTAVPRFVGLTPIGAGLGLEFHVMDKSDRELWAAHYRRGLALERVMGRLP